MVCTGIEEVGDDSGQTPFVCPQVVEDIESASQVSIEFQASRHIQPRGKLVEEPLAPPAVGLPCVGKPPGQIGEEPLRFHGKTISVVPAEVVNMQVLDVLVSRELEPLPVERGDERAAESAALLSSRDGAPGRPVHLQRPGLPGGDGHGDPARRRRERIEADLEAAYVTLEGTRRDYRYG